MQLPLNKTHQTTWKVQGTHQSNGELDLDITKDKYYEVKQEYNQKDDDDEPYHPAAGASKTP